MASCEDGATLFTLPTGVEVQEEICLRLRFLASFPTLVVLHQWLPSYGQTFISPVVGGFSQDPGTTVLPFPEMARLSLPDLLPNYRPAWKAVFKALSADP